MGALTTTNPLDLTDATSKLITRGTLVLSSTYARGGETWVPQNFGLQRVERLRVFPAQGLVFETDLTNKKLKAFYDNFGGVLNTNVTSTPSTTGAGDPLVSFVLKANTLSTNGQSLYVKTWGITANNASAKAVTITFGGTGLLASNGIVLTTSVAGSWTLDAYIFRVSAGNQTCVCEGSQGPTSAIAIPLTSALTLDETTDLTLQTQTVAAGAGADIVSKGFTVQLFNDGTVTPGAEVRTGADLSGITLQYEAVGS